MASSSSSTMGGLSNGADVSTEPACGPERMSTCLADVLILPRQKKTERKSAVTRGGSHLATTWRTAIYRSHYEPNETKNESGIGGARRRARRAKEYRRKRVTTDV